MNSQTTDLEERVLGKLEEVLDPCSTFTAHPKSVVDLGLVDGISIEGGSVSVDLLPTNQFCMYIPHISEDIENRVGEITGVNSVTVETVADKVWNQDRMTEEAYEKREEYLRERVEANDISPAYDGEEWSEEVTIHKGGTDG